MKRLKKIAVSQSPSASGTNLAPYSQLRSIHENVDTPLRTVAEHMNSNTDIMVKRRWPALWLPMQVGAGHGLGTQDIDTAVYAANLAANHQMQQDSCLKNFVGSGTHCT